MTAPYANVTERDDTARIPAGNGIYGALQIPAPIGPLERQLVDSDTKLLSLFTVNNKVEVGYDLSFYSALAYLKKSDKLWVKRVAAEDALYGGCVLTVGSTVAAHSLSNGLVDPTAYAWAPTGSGEAKETVKVITKDDFNGSLGGKYFVLPGQEEFIFIKVNARSEVVELTCNADINGSLNNAYFILPKSADGTEDGFYVWFNVNNAGTDPGETAGLSGTGLQVSLATNASIDDVANGIAEAISQSGFSGTINGNVLTITKTEKGACIRGNAGSTGFKYSTTTIGLDATEDVIVQGMTGYPATIEGNALATSVAEAVSNAASETGNFTSTFSGAEVTIIAGQAGPQLNAIDGSGTQATGFNIQTTKQGSLQSGSECLLLYFENPCAASGEFLVKVFNYEDYPEKTNIPGSFVIEIYRKSNLNSYVESFVCSRDKTAKDGYGRNIYVEDVLLGSQFLRALDNEAVDSDEIPASVPNGLFLSGGSDGSAVTTSNMVQAAQYLKNRDDVEVSLLMDGGWTATAYKTALNEIAVSRGDAVAITSIPYYIEAASQYMNSIINYRKYEYNVNSSYSAVYTPHVNIYDYFNDRYIDVAPDGYVAGAISDADKNYKIWYPVLGFKRGTLTNVQDLHRKYTSSEMDLLYANQINPIRFFPGKGIVIWGQKTMQAQATDLDRLNVRLLLIAMKPRLQEFLLNYVGELNTEGNRNNLKSTIDNYMDLIKANDGVYEYQTVCDETINTPAVIANNQLLVHLYIKPTKAIEYIDMTIILTPLDVSFS